MTEKVTGNAQPGACVDVLLRCLIRLNPCVVPRRLSFDENVCSKEGGKETTGFACRLYPSHGPLRFITSHSRFALASAMREMKRLKRRLAQTYNGGHNCNPTYRHVDSSVRAKWIRGSGNEKVNVPIRTELYYLPIFVFHINFDCYRGMK